MTISEKLIVSIEVAETERSRHYWLTKQANNGTGKSVEGTEAAILFAPWEKFRDGNDLFPQGTGEFYKFIKRTSPNLSVAIAAAQENYQEVTLHGHEFRFPTVLLKEALVAVFVGLCADYLLHEKADPTKDTAQLEVIVEGTAGRCVSVKYKGPAGTLPQRVLEEVERCRTPVPTEKQQPRKGGFGKAQPKSSKDGSAD